MKLEKQVSNLELSLKLKELLVKQESLFYWNKWHRAWGIEYTLNNKHLVGHEAVSAFTSAELGEILPVGRTRTRSGEPNKNGDRWICWFLDANENGEFDLMRHWEFGKTEAEARAKMVIYLRKNNLLNFIAKELISEKRRKAS